MKILVTGANGFIAQTLIDRLLTEGHTVIGLDIVERQHRAMSYNYLPLIADITNPKIIDDDYGALLQFKDVDFCFHLAAMADVNDVREQRQKAWEVNMHGTFNIVELCRKLNIPMEYTSTACVYGNTPQHPSTEDGPTLPTDWYGVTKRAGEEIVKGLLNRYVILRFGTTFGLHMREALCTDIFLKQAMQHKPFTVYGDGEQTRNFIYVNDLVDGCIQAMKFLVNGGGNEIFNLVGSGAYSINDLADICYRIVHDNTPLNIKDYCEYHPMRPEDIKTENISIEKARSMLNWNPQTTLYSGLKRVYDQWIENYSKEIAERVKNDK